jgi:hypothetical protein
LDDKPARREERWPTRALAVFFRSTVTTFLELIGLSDDIAKLKHFEAVTIDQHKGLLAGVDDTARSIVGQPLATVEEFINDNRALFEMHYPEAYVVPLRRWRWVVVALKRAAPSRRQLD